MGAFKNNIWVQAYELKDKEKYNILESVMQPDGHSFCGNIILDSFNMSYRDWRQYFRPKVWKENTMGDKKILNVRSDCMHIKRNTAHYSKVLVRLFL